ncbi:MAG: xanthine dehydrogenase family protein molybdopterin-binding subunit [Gemmatimonadaceae bacterium]
MARKPGKPRFVVTKIEVEGREETKIVEMPEFSPAPWREDAGLKVVGKRATRRDALEKVTGAAHYTADIALPGMLHAAILRAPIASGGVTRLDLSDALAMPGVRGAITQADVPGITIGGFPLFDRVIRYAGQPIAAVCAESLDEAFRALASIVVETTIRAHAVTAEEALSPGAPFVHGRKNRTDNSPDVVERGDVEKGLSAAEIIVSREYRTPVAIHTALEPHGAVARWTGDHVTVWESTQAVFAVRSEVANGFGLPLSNVRVISEYMGGGFGAKNEAGPHTFAAIALSRITRRPVRCVNDRESEQLDTGNRPATIQRVTLGAKQDGKLTAIVLDADIPLGVGGWQGGPAQIYHEMYACKNVRSSETFAYINAAAMTSFRAPGHAEGAFGLERAMDELARELGMDPLDLRLANYARRDQRKDRVYSAKRLDDCYSQGAKRFGWKLREPTRTRHGAATSTRGVAVRRGFGMASQVWGTGGGPPAYAIVRLNTDGSADVLAGTQDLGTGSRTVLAQIAAEALGAKLENVRVVLGDTERLPYAPNSWGSMTIPSVGPAVRMAAEDARSALIAAAAGLMEVAPSRVAVSDGVVRVSRGRKRMSIRDVTEALGDVMIIGRGSRAPNANSMAIASFGAQFAEVEVDMETGIVRVIRIVAAHDAGRIVNPELAESQLHGGIIQGIGYALFEERVMDRSLGVPVNPTMHDYKIPTMSDVPEIDAFFVASVDTRANHTGAKGLAEPPIIPTAPAIANAVADAIGADITEIPLAPWRVLEAIGGSSR